MWKRANVWEQTCFAKKKTARTVWMVWHIIHDLCGLLVGLHETFFNGTLDTSSPPRPVRHTARAHDFEKDSFFAPTTRAWYAHTCTYNVCTSVGMPHWERANALGAQHNDTTRRDGAATQHIHTQRRRREKNVVVVIMKITDFSKMLPALRPGKVAAATPVDSLFGRAPKRHVHEGGGIGWLRWSWFGSMGPYTMCWSVLPTVRLLAKRQTIHSWHFKQHKNKTRQRDREKKNTYT